MHRLYICGMFRAYGYISIGIILSGWVFYQLVIKKKKIRELRHEIVFIVFFIAVWAAIYYWALH